MKKTLLRIVLLTFMSITTVLLLMYIQPVIYSNFQSEFGRHKVIIDVLNNKANRNNNIIIFGDSRAMFGIDTRIIKKTYGFNGDIYNLSSVAQSPYESGYYYGKIGKSTKIVVQCISPSFFTKNISNNISNEKAISMFLSGYRIDNNYIFRDEYNMVFKNSVVENYFNARTYYRSYFNTYLRKLFDNEKFNEFQLESLYFPNPTTMIKHPDYPFFKYNCERYKIIDNPQSQMCFLFETKKYFDSKGVKYVLLFLPVNPDECDNSYDEFKIIAKDITAKTKIEIIDLSELFKNNYYFYDGLHCNKLGACIISQEISKQL